MKKRSIVVFDIGGTYFRHNLFDEAKGLLEDGAAAKVASPSFRANPGVPAGELTGLLVEKLSATTDEIKSRNPGLRIDGIGIAFPGPVDRQGVVRTAPPLWGDLVKDYPLRSNLESRLAHKVFVLNDVSAACWYYRNKVKADRFCVITVSSGIGNKIFDVKHEDKIITLDNGLGGEIGHAFTGHSENDLTCDCGACGHLGGIASGRGTERFARRYADREKKAFSASLLSALAKSDPAGIDNYVLVEAVEKGDKFAREIVKKSSWYLALMIQQIYMVMGVEKFVIIGGFALSFGEAYKKILIENLQAMGVWGLQDKEIAWLIELGENDDGVNLRGMGEYVLYNLEQGREQK
jgi:predicted NBD/HSP70 family sugar kinase